MSNFSRRMHYLCVIKWATTVVAEVSDREINTTLQYLPLFQQQE
jgi:hypothetical protein